jgi:ribose transport system permease protein
VVAVHEFGVSAVLVCLVVLVAVRHPRFLEMRSLTNIGQQAAFFGIIALGMVFLLAMREIDLSVGSTYALVTIVSATLIRDGLDPWIGAGVAILLGMVLGGLNGVLANVFKLPLIIVTLGTLTAYRGLSLVVSNSVSVGGQPIDHALYSKLGADVLDVPVIVIVFLVVTVLLTFVLLSTPFGYAVRAIGSNQEAARLTGYAIGRTRLAVCVLVGGLCGLSGALTLAFFGAADPGVGTGYELLVVAAAIIGGTSLAGGSGSVPGAMIGALIISVIGAGLTQFGVSAAWGTFVTGSVIVTAVAFDAFLRRRAGARA